MTQILRNRSSKGFMVAGFTRTHSQCLLYVCYVVHCYNTAGPNNSDFFNEFLDLSHHFDLNQTAVDSAWPTPVRSYVRLCQKSQSLENILEQSFNLTSLILISYNCSLVLLEDSSPRAGSRHTWSIHKGESLLALKDISSDWIQPN